MSQCRSHCFDSCVASRAVDAVDRVPSSIAVYTDSDFSQKAIHFLYGAKNDTVWKMWQEIDRICSQKCRNADCFNDEYAPKVVSTWPSGNIAVSLYLTNQPDISTKLHPKMNLIDFITYVLSTLSFWYGFSPINCVQLCTGAERVAASGLRDKSDSRKLKLVQKPFKLFIRRN